MSANNSINRESLIKLVGLLRPALATQDYIPILRHIQFSGGAASAYNDIAAIRIALPDDLADLELCLPGEMLAKTLASFNAETVMLQPTKEDAVLVASGRSKVKLASLKAKDHPLQIPEENKPAVIAINDSIMAGIQRCLMAVGNDPTRPATMGITLEAQDGKAFLYSTDNATISAYETDSKIKLPGDAPVILPTFFCEQLLSLAKAFPKTEIEVELQAGALVAYFFGDKDAEVAVLFQKTLVDLEPLDFPAHIAKHCKPKEVNKRLIPIPAAFDSALQRALLVLADSADKATKFAFTAEGVKLISVSSTSEATDPMDLEDDGGDLPDDFSIDPELVARACKACTKIAFFPRVLVMTDDKVKFLHLIAHSN